MDLPKIDRIAQLTGHDGAVYALSPGPEADQVLSGSADKMVAAWSLTDHGPAPFAIRLESTIYSLCLIREKQLLLIGTSHGSIHVIDLEKKQEVRHFTLHKGGIFDIQATKSGRFFVLSADGSLSVWDLDQLALERHFPVCHEKLRQVAIREDEKEIAVACGDGLVRIYETENFQLTHRLEGHDGSVYSVAYHPNGKSLVSGGKDAHLRFWSTEESYRLIRSIAAHNFAIYSIVFHPNGQWVATGSRDKTVKLWEAESFDLIKRLERLQDRGHANSVNRLLWSENGEYLVSTGDDRTLILWKVG